LLVARLGYIAGATWARAICDVGRGHWRCWRLAEAYIEMPFEFARPNVRKPVDGIASHAEKVGPGEGGKGEAREERSPALKILPS